MGRAVLAPHNFTFHTVRTAAGAQAELDTPEPDSASHTLPN